jgi:phosphatidylserine/phosphatidylglycerophosphate/cardiolipin synthase-like enzyme
MEDLKLAIVELIEHLPENIINLLKQKISSREIHNGVSTNQMLDVMQSKHIHPSDILKFLNAWSANEMITGDIVCLIIETAQEMKNRINNRLPLIEPVWTGPYPPSGGRARPTLNVIAEMIQSSERDILIAGYAFSSHVESVRSLIELTAYAVQRGCDVTIAINHNGQNYEGLTSIWPKYVPFPNLLYWRGRPEDRNASLHSKLVIVDRRDILITSANFTFHGLESNIETGVRIKGHPIARQMAEFFFELERKKILLPFK